MLKLARVSHTSDLRYLIYLEYKLFNCCEKMPQEDTVTTEVMEKCNINRGCGPKLQPVWC